MSWDVMILNLRNASPAPSVQAIEKTDVQPLGPAAEVRELISSSLPGVDWSEPSWGRFRDSRNELWIEINTGKDDPIEHMMLHDRGTGDAISAIMAVIRPRAWSAVDCTTGEFLDPDDPSDAGWRRFQEFRDQVVGRSGPVEIWARRPRGHDARLWAAGFAWLCGASACLCTRFSGVEWRIGGLLAGLIVGGLAGFAVASLLNSRKR
jgi:hypothetical protein